MTYVFLNVPFYYWASYQFIFLQIYRVGPNFESDPYGKSSGVFSVTTFCTIFTNDDHLHSRQETQDQT